MSTEDFVRGGSLDHGGGAVLSAPFRDPLDPGPIAVLDTSSSALAAVSEPLSTYVLAYHIPGENMGPPRRPTGRPPTRMMKPHRVTWARLAFDSIKRILKVIPIIDDMMEEVLKLQELIEVSHQCRPVLSRQRFMRPDQLRHGRLPDDYETCPNRC
jgi:hypothetical protein